MKIIKQGSLKRTHKGTCRTCGCKVECDTNELTLCPSRPGEGNTWYVKCPTKNCFGHIYFY